MPREIQVHLQHPTSTAIRHLFKLGIRGEELVVEVGGALAEAPCATRDSRHLGVSVRLIEVDGLSGAVKRAPLTQGGARARDGLSGVGGVSRAQIARVGARGAAMAATGARVGEESDLSPTY